MKRPESIDVEAQESVRKHHKEHCDLYKKANSYAKSMIASTVTDAVYQKIMDKETAFEAWEALKQLLKISCLKFAHSFFAFSWAPGEDVSIHIAKLRSLWNELNNGFQAREEATKSERPKQESKYKSKSRKEDSCNYRKRKGHWVKDCRKWISDERPPMSKLSDTHSNTVSVNITLMSMSEEVCTSETSPISYWIDTGATRHVTRSGVRRGPPPTVHRVSRLKAEMNYTKSLGTKRDREKERKWVSGAAKRKSCIQPGLKFRANFEPILPKEMIEVHTVLADSSLLQLYQERWGHQDKRHIRSMLEKELGIRIKLDKELYKAGKCDDHTELKLEDRIREDTNQGKYEEQLIKIEDNPIERTQSQEDLSDSEIDRKEDAEPTSDRQVRNRSLLHKPKRFEYHIMEAVIFR
ncbi:integrase catalytic domain-containing protein [Trichonephila clavipes]|nr:integrase catalytic domain-containing protein [Trichonephila clavipes]